MLKSVTIPYDEEIKALNAKVKPALERESAMAAKRKDLDALVRIKADIERTDKGLLLTEADGPPPEPLKYVYIAYKLELAKIELAKKISFTDAKQRYDKGLTQVQDELTTKQKVEEALYVKNLREELISEGSNKRLAALNATDKGSRKESDKGKAMPSAEQPGVGTNNINTETSQLNSADYFSGKVYKDLDAALKEATTKSKPVWVMAYGKDEARHRRHWLLHWFMELEETKTLVQSNFIQVLVPFSDPAVAKILDPQDNTERVMLFVLSPNGETAKKLVVNHNAQDALDKAKGIIDKICPKPEPEVPDMSLSNMTLDEFKGWLETVTIAELADEKNVFEYDGTTITSVGTARQTPRVHIGVSVKLGIISVPFSVEVATIRIADNLKTATVTYNSEEQPIPAKITAKPKG